MKDQIVNPYIRFRRKAQGRFANRVSLGSHARAISVDETRCFFITDAYMGVGASDMVEIVFNKDTTACSTGWDVKKNGVSFASQSFIGNIASNIIGIFANDGTSVDSGSPTDVITLDYTPGTCGALGVDDCLLEGYTDFAVDNYIYGPETARVGNVGDNIIVILMNAPVQTIGDAWEVEIDSVAQTITDSEIVSGDRIHLTISNDVSAGQTVTLTQNRAGVRCKALDGRECYWFYDYPVNNAVGSDFWFQEAMSGYWLVEGGLGGWGLE